MERGGHQASNYKYCNADGINERECVQRRLACSVGVSPTGARVRSPVAWIARVEETKLVKPIDKAIFGMVSESPGHNASEPRGGPENLLNPGGRAYCLQAKAIWSVAA